METVKPKWRSLQLVVAAAALALGFSVPAYAATTYVDCNTKGLDPESAFDHVFFSRLGNNGRGNGGESIDIVVDLATPTLDATVTCINTADEETGGSLFARFGGGPLIDLGPYWPEVDPGTSGNADANAASASASSNQIVHEFTEQTSGGINVGSIDPATGTHDIYSATLSSDGTGSYTVWFSRVRYTEAGGWEDLGGGVAYGVPSSRASVHPSGIRIEMAPGDWTEIYVGQGIAVNVTGWDSHTFETRENVGPRITTTPCSRRVVHGQRWEKQLHAAGTIDGFSFDSRIYEYPDLPPYWYFPAEGEKGRIQEVREPDCPYSDD